MFVRGSLALFCAAGICGFLAFGFEPTAGSKLIDLLFLMFVAGFLACFLSLVGQRIAATSKERGAIRRPHTGANTDADS